MLLNDAGPMPEQLPQPLWTMAVDSAITALDELEYSQAEDVEGHLHVIAGQGLESERGFFDREIARLTAYVVMAVNLDRVVRTQHAFLATLAKAGGSKKKVPRQCPCADGTA
ncbi:MAG: hypothetical protein HYY06_01510 [Deltaproteobacteria bacterium]|nr:hypothetical protein [Deltaproteobacteria bacterium]